MSAPLENEPIAEVTTPSPALLRARKRRSRREKRGIALVMVLGAITVLTVFLTQLQAETSSELASALAEQDSLRGEYYARGAVNLARLLIATEPAIRQTMGPMAALLLNGRKLPQIPVWAFSDMVLGAFNGTEGAQAFSGLLPAADYSTAKNLGVTGGGHYELNIVDEDSKINVNIPAIQAGAVTSELRLATQLLGLFTPVQYNPLFEGRDADGQFSDRATVCGAIVDWADPDENLFGCNPQASGPSVGGAEDNFYQTINLPYRRKNAAFDSLEELRMVRGMGDDFWATFVDPEPNNPKKRIMTVWGQGGVNVNTANAMTILAIVCGAAPDAELCNDPLQMQTFVMAITMVRSISMGAPLFGSTAEFVSAMQGKGMVGQIFTTLQLKPVVFKDTKGLASAITTSSKMFSIYADGIVPGYRKETRVRIHAVIDFRTAQALGTGATSPFQQSTPATAGSATAAAVPNNQPSADMSPDAVRAMLESSPGGNIVYWRIE